MFGWCAPITGATAAVYTCIYVEALVCFASRFTKLLCRLHLCNSDLFIPHTYRNFLRPLFSHRETLCTLACVPCTFNGFPITYTNKRQRYTYVQPVKNFVLCVGACLFCLVFSSIRPPQGSLALCWGA